jgi:aminoglycoside phosphotransferase (APT) family kinase protein
MDTPDSLNIEDHRALVDYLRARGCVPRAETPRLTNLQGGISNRTVLVEQTGGNAFVLKQALPRLRVATDWPSDPRRIHQEALGLTWLGRLAPPGSIPSLLFEDLSHHLLAMQAVPRPHENWKVRLLSGALQASHVEQFGTLLGTIHRRSREYEAELRRIFDDRSFFESLRLEPYYRFTASRHPAAAAFFTNLIAETLATRVALVHGDYSPKNILIHSGQLVLLDHEVIHWGDPAFDIGFSMTHLLSKARHLPAQRTAFLRAAEVYWQAYQSAAGEFLLANSFEPRAVRHTIGCLLARVDGRSPLEYLSADEQEHQRTFALSLMENLPDGIATFIDQVRLNC